MRLPPASCRTSTLALTELDRKPSSCPYLFTWNGTRFEFITDFMGGGEMGYRHAPGVLNHPDPEEFTRIDGSRLVPRNGRYELRVTNELEETLFLDQARLIAVDHPASVEVHPREGAFSPPFPGFQLYAAADARPVARAIDDAGRDVTARLLATDRQFVDGLPLERIRGYAKPHALTLDLGPAPAGDAATLLLLTGWTDYAFSADNVAAHQAGLPLDPPALQVRDAQRPLADRDRRDRDPGRPAADHRRRPVEAPLRRRARSAAGDEHARLLGSRAGRHAGIAP